MESTWGPYGIYGIYKESMRSPGGVQVEYMEYTRSLEGVHMESTRTLWSPHGVHGYPWGSVTYRRGGVGGARCLRAPRDGYR